MKALHNIKKNYKKVSCHIKLQKKNIFKFIALCLSKTIIFVLFCKIVTIFLTNSIWKYSFLGAFIRWILKQDKQGKIIKKYFSWMLQGKVHSHVKHLNTNDLHLRESKTSIGSRFLLRLANSECTQNIKFWVLTKK